MDLTEASGRSRVDNIADHPPLEATNVCGSSQDVMQ